MRFSSVRVLLLSAFFLLAFPLSAHAQTPDTMEYSGSLSPTDSLLLEADGTVTLRSSSSSTWTLDATNTVKKHVLIGTTNADERPAYQMSVQREDNRVVVRPEPRPKLKGAGILYLSESLRHDVVAPSASTVILRCNEADVDATASFRNLVINQREGSVALRLDRATAGDVDVRSRDGSVSVNGEDVGSAFTMTGDGSNRVEVLLYEGDVHLDVLPLSPNGS
jgi:hypothetical protein